MKTVFQHIREHMDIPKERRPSLNELRNNEWSKEFENYMRRRLIVGALRYKTFAEKFHSDHGYKLIESAITRLKLYQETGNMEHLADVANICMIEYNSPSHKSPHWSPIDDGDHHVEKEQK